MLVLYLQNPSIIYIAKIYIYNFFSGIYFHVNYVTSITILYVEKITNIYKTFFKFTNLIFLPHKRASATRGLLTRYVKRHAFLGYHFGSPPYIRVISESLKEQCPSVDILALMLPNLKLIWQIILKISRESGFKDQKSTIKKANFYFIFFRRNRRYNW